MKDLIRQSFFLASFLSALAACSPDIAIKKSNVLNSASSAASLVLGGSSSASDNAAPAADTAPSLQSDGSVVLSVSSDLKTNERKYIQISGVILPSVGVLYDHELANFPTTLDGEKELAHLASLTFAYLLQHCHDDYAADYPDIAVSSVGSPLTDKQIRTNFDQVAKCSYEKFSAKPYWIPKLVADVDICKAELGSDWRLPNEDDFSQWNDKDFESLQEALVADKDNVNWGAFYFSMHVYVRGKDGSIKVANLDPGVVGSRISDLNLTDDQMKQHLEGARSLRCVKISN